MQYSIPLPSGFSLFTVEYGIPCTATANVAVNIKLNGVLVDSVDETCAVGSANPEQCGHTVMNGCWKTLSMAYSHGAVLTIEEYRHTIGAIKTIKLSK